MALSGCAVLATLLHFAATKRFAYERKLGYGLVPALLGYACLGQRLIAWPRRVATSGGRDAVLLGTIVLMVPGLRGPVTDRAYEAFGPESTNSRSRRPSSAGAARPGDGRTDPLDFPTGWSDAVILATPDTAVDLLLVEKNALFLWPRSENRPASRAAPGLANAAFVVQEGVYRIVRLPCRVEGPRTGPSEERAAALWYPAFNAVAVSPRQRASVSPRASFPTTRSPRVTKRSSTCSAG